MLLPSKCKGSSLDAQMHLKMMRCMPCTLCTLTFSGQVTTFRCNTDACSGRVTPEALRGFHSICACTTITTAERTERMRLALSLAVASLSVCLACGAEAESLIHTGPARWGDSLVDMIVLLRMVPGGVTLGDLHCANQCCCCEFRHGAHAALDLSGLLDQPPAVSGRILICLRKASMSTIILYWSSWMR